MTSQQIEDLANLLTARLSATFKGEFEIVNMKLDSIQKVVDISLANADEDRKDLAQMKISEATLSQGIKEVVDMISTMSKRISAKVVDQTNGAIESAAEKVAEQVEPTMQRAMNKIQKGIPLNQKPPFWKLWGRKKI